MESEDTSYSGTWLKAQEAYWKSWFSFCQQSAELGINKEVPLPWAKGLESWWKAVGAEVPEPGQPFLQQIVEQAKSFVGLSEKFGEFFKDADGSRWQELLGDKIEELKKGFAENPAAFNYSNDWTRLLPFAAFPTDIWNRTVSANNLFSGDIFKTLRTDSFGTVSEPFKGQLEQLLSIPGVGYNRECQEDIQQAGKLYLEYDQALRVYNQAHARLSIDSLELLLAKTNSTAAEGKQIKSLRQLYDLWVDCGEEAYAKFAFSEEYSELYSRLVNALMQLKKHQQQMTDRLAAALNLPTSQGLKTIQSRQQDLRRELARLQAKVRDLSSTQEPTSVGSAKNELEILQEQLASLAAKVQKLENSTVVTAPDKDAGPPPAAIQPEPKRAPSTSVRPVKSTRSRG